MVEDITNFTRVEIWKFAVLQRGRVQGRNVRLVAKVDDGSNVVIALMWSNTKASFWIDERTTITDEGPFYCSCNFVIPI